MLEQVWNNFCGKKQLTFVCFQFKIPLSWNGKKWPLCSLFGQLQIEFKITTAWLHGESSIFWASYSIISTLCLIFIGVSFSMMWGHKFPFLGQLPKGSCRCFCPVSRHFLLSSFVDTWTFCGRLFTCVDYILIKVWHVLTVIVNCSTSHLVIAVHLLCNNDACMIA